MLNWEQLINQCNNCNKCGLASQRTNVVIGDGNRNANIMMIGEGPGEQEDLIGIPFVGAAGRLLNLLLDGLGVSRADCYIANVVKCRPPMNRIPFENEAEACLPYLQNQIELIKPKIIVCLGATALKYVVGSSAKITRDRGQWMKINSAWIMPTFHPAALLRDNDKKILMWQDFKKVRAKMEEI